MKHTIIDVMRTGKHSCQIETYDSQSEADAIDALFTANGLPATCPVHGAIRTRFWNSRIFSGCEKLVSKTSGDNRAGICDTRKAGT